MPGPSAVRAYAVYALFFAVVFAAFVYPRLPFLSHAYWHMPVIFGVLALQSRSGTRKTEARFRERRQFPCRLREVPGGGAGLSRHWRSAVVVPGYRRLTITGHAAEKPPATQPTWDEPIPEGLAQLQDVLEILRREPSLMEALRFWPHVQVARYRADGAVVEIAAPPRYLDGAREVLQEPAEGP